MEGLELFSILKMQRIFFGLTSYGTRGSTSRLNPYARISGCAGRAVEQAAKLTPLRSTQWSIS